MESIDTRFTLIASNGDKLYPYKKNQRSTGRYGFALSGPGERDRDGGGTYVDDLAEVVHRVVFDGWSVRAKTIDKPGRQRDGSVGFAKRSIVQYEISEDLKSIIKDAQIKPRKIERANSEDESKPVIEEIIVSEPTNSEIDEKILKQIMTRRGQPEFRSQLLLAFNGKCCITYCSVESVLEAAHIIPFSEKPDYSITNGLLLRADIHTLFDLHLLGINGTGMVTLSGQLVGSDYEKYSGLVVAKNIPPAMKENLERRYQLFLHVAEG
jgi:hypothetical protein